MPTEHDPHTQLIADELRRRGYHVQWWNRWCFTADVRGENVTFWSTRSGLNTQIAAQLARRKDMTDKVLRAAGVRVPEGGAFRRVQRKQALGFASRRWPVVVKPIASRGKAQGATLGVDSREMFHEAFDKALKVSPYVMVQDTVQGEEARFLVVGGRCVSVLRKRMDSKTGKQVPGVYDEITAETHPYYKHEAERAIEAFPGLGLAGLDIIAPDWSTEGPYAVIEVNAAPGVKGHHIAQTVPFDAAAAIVDELEARAVKD